MITDQIAQNLFRLERNLTPNNNSLYVSVKSGQQTQASTRESSEEREEYATRGAVSHQYQVEWIDPLSVVSETVRNRK